MRSTQSAFVTAAGVHRATLSKRWSSNVSICGRSFHTTLVTRQREQQKLKHFYPSDNQSNHSVTPIYASETKTQTQQQTDWNDVSILEISRPCEDHFLLRVNVGITFELGSLCDAYRVPGMYVKLRPTDSESRGIKPGFFAISSPPTVSGEFEFLIKDSPGVQWISELSDGDTIQSSPVMGKGFPFSSLQPVPSDVLLFATGSGIAPIRAAIESVLNGVYPRKRRSVTLYYGARTPQVMAYKDRFQLWSDLNVNVVPVISRPQNADTNWDGRTGYVQHALADIGVQDPENTAALLCGVKGMSEEVKESLLQYGVPEDRILFNF